MERTQETSWEGGASAGNGRGQQVVGVGQAVEERVPAGFTPQIAPFNTLCSNRCKINYTRVISALARKRL